MFENGLESEKIRSRGGIGLWRDWVEGKIMPRMPVVQGTNPMLVSKMYKEYFASGWNQLLLKSSYNRSYVTALGLEVENKVIHEVAAMDWHYGM